MAVLIAAAGAQRAYALDKKFSSVVAHYILGSFYEKTGKIDRAIAEYEKALRQDNKNPHAHMSLGVAYLKKNNIPRAVEELNLASKYDPDAVEPHAILALLYFSQENAQAAGREYETALTKASQLDPTNINIYRSLAVVHLHKKNFTAAESTFNLILKISPKDAEALFYLANVYDETGRDNLVEKTLRACLEIKPDYAQALNYLGYFFAETNRNLAEAENLIKKALQAEPENGAYADSLGWVYFKQGKIKEAAAELEKAKDLLDDPVIYDHLGDVYLKLKDTGRAKDNWLKSLKLDGSQEKVKKKLESIK
ncbi:MAG: tetratricopeptide repeat protein [Candidatus Omnitrophica bacterium]|nr:tetratricopeptide repeat protein [Candidatus Omnitrophota bacterium]